MLARVSMLAAPPLLCSALAAHAVTLSTPVIQGELTGRSHGAAAASCEIARADTTTNASGARPEGVM